MFRIIPVPTRLWKRRPEYQVGKGKIIGGTADGEKTLSHQRSQLGSLIHHLDISHCYTVAGLSGQGGMPEDVASARKNIPGHHQIYLQEPVNWPQLPAGIGALGTGIQRTLRHRCAGSNRIFR